METRHYKIVLFGNGGVGKTTLLTRYMQNRFEPVYHPTIEAEVHPLEFRTNHGIIRVNVWDTAGQERNTGLVDGYLVNANLAVVFYSVDSKLSAKRISYWEGLCGSVPSLVVGTKSNLPNTTNLDTPLVNAKTGAGIREFWEKVLSTLTGDLTIKLDD